VPGTLLIRDASLRGGRICDIRIAGGRIVAIGEGFLPETSGEVIDAGGGLLLPGLHDHHIHMAATAASMASIRCGPPEVTDAAGLAAALAVPGEGWLRGIGWHESVGGAIDRRWLDAVAPDRPVRIQHRSGRLWLFNSAGLERLLASGLAPPAGLDQAGGRLFDEDGWARRALGGVMPSLADAGAALARHGVTGVTEISPANDAAVAASVAAQRRSGALPQKVLLAGQASLSRAALDPLLRLGPVKLHLHEAHLPDFDATVAAIQAAHDQGRAVAVHCVTLTELVFTLAAIREAGAMPGDRIEHGSIAPDEQVAEIAALGLAVVTQPHFVAERGDAYRADIPEEDWPHLYRLRAFRAAGVALAGGSDAPFGRPDPWAAMAAAVSRRTTGGQVIGAGEALTPEEALDLFLADPADLGRRRTIAVGMPADLCLLSVSWPVARARLSAEWVRATLIDGRLVHHRVDEAPAERHGGAHALA
jgi:predicted amidohydrolase YtcJ